MPWYVIAFLAFNAALALFVGWWDSRFSSRSQRKADRDRAARKNEME